VHTGDALGFKAKPRGYWLSEKGKNLRALLEKFAKSRNFDPLVASNWYSVNFTTVAKFTVCETSIPFILFYIFPLILSRLFLVVEPYI
jgi:hypothetical protein